jgi:hypothetical protein
MPKGRPTPPLQRFHLCRANFRRCKNEDFLPEYRYDASAKEKPSNGDWELFSALKVKDN